MNRSKRKLSHPDLYTQYFPQSYCFIVKDCDTPITPNKIHTHKQKSSQMSTLSYRSKNRNLSSIDKHSYSINKIPTFTINTEQRTIRSLRKDSKKNNLRKEFQLEKIKTTKKIENILNKKKQKLTLNTQRKLNNEQKHNFKSVNILTSRYISNEQNKIKSTKSSKTDKTTQNSFINKCEHGGQKIKNEKIRHENDRKVIFKFKLRQKNLEVLLLRCSKVMAQYHERITFLRKQNEFLRFENRKLKKYQKETR